MYQIYPMSFQDSNGDGIGDLRGIINRVEYLSNLRVDLIWLGPVFKSPMIDNGYDISDYYQIHPDYGSMGDFDELLDLLHQHDIKLIMDLVVNHSSDQHAWFKESRKSKDNAYRDFYFWKKGVNGGPPNNWKAWFGGDAWVYDKLTDEYYLALFTPNQPDLNWENPKVRNAIYEMMRFWLNKGVDGFRMDVISLISKRLEFESASSTNLMHLANNYYANGPRIHEYLKEMNKKVLSKYDIVTVGEGPGITKELANDYIGNDRGELNMLFQLELMFLDNGPGGKFDPQAVSLVEFKKLFVEWDRAVGERGWNNIFLDNHDFPRMLSRWGSESFRVKSAQLLATFLMTMKGTPCIYQGSEIGMTNVRFDKIEDYRDIETINYHANQMAAGLSHEEILKQIHVQGRDNVRTPMQWSDEENAGFSKGNPWIGLNPNYPEINVEKDLQSTDSIIKYYQKLIRFKKGSQVLVNGDFQDILPKHPQLYVYERTYNSEIIRVVLNFSDKPVPLPDDLSVCADTVLFSNYEVLDDLDQLNPWQAIVQNVQT